MKKLLVMMLMALSLAAIAPAITASPAFAAQARCAIGELQAPWWWGNKNALDRTGGAHVLAIRLPAQTGKDALLWTLSGNENQKWRHRCVGYDLANGRNIWQLKYAPNTSLCLTDVGVTQDVIIEECDINNALQEWVRVERGSYTALKNWGTGRCLQPQGSLTADGTSIRSVECNYGLASQLWY
jgi:ricin-type beta-trefoil lectin protein